MSPDVRRMSAADYATAKREVFRQIHIAERRRAEEREIERIRSKHPEIARAGDAATLEGYRANLRALVDAEIRMNECATAKAEAAKQPSLFARELAAERLASAVQTHDDLLRAVVAAHATLPQS